MSDFGTFIGTTLPQEPASSETKPAETKTEDNFGPRFASLAKKERELQKRSEEWKKERETHQNTLKEYEELKKWKSSRETEHEDINDLLESRGLNFEKVTDYYLKGGKPSPEDLIARSEKKLQEKIDALENERLEKEHKETETKAQEQITGFKKHIATFAAENGFELIAETSGQDLVFATMEEHFQKSGKILDVKEACELVEEHLEEQELAKIMKIKKLRAKLGIADTEQEPTSGVEHKAPQVSGPTTLTTRMTQSGEPKKSSIADRAELTKQAAKHLRWTT